MNETVEQRVEKIKSNLDPNKPLLEITIPIPLRSGTISFRREFIQKLTLIASRLKFCYAEKYNVIILPEDVSINGPNVVQLHIGADANLDEMIKFLDEKVTELGGHEDDPS